MRRCNGLQGGGYRCVPGGSVWARAAVVVVVTVVTVVTLMVVVVVAVVRYSNKLGFAASMMPEVNNDVFA